MVKDTICPYCNTNEHVMKLGESWNGKKRFACKKCHKSFYTEELSPSEKKNNFKEEFKKELRKMKEEKETIKQIEDTYSELATQRANEEGAKGENELEVDKLEEEIKEKRKKVIELKEQAIDDELSGFSIPSYREG